MLKLKDADGSCAFLHILSWNEAFEETLLGFVSHDLLTKVFISSLMHASLGVLFFAQYFRPANLYAFCIVEYFFDLKVRRYDLLL